MQWGKWAGMVGWMRTAACVWSAEFHASGAGGRQEGQCTARPGADLDFEWPLLTWERFWAQQKGGKACLGSYVGSSCSRHGVWCPGHDWSWSDS